MLNKYIGNPTEHSDLFLTERSDEVMLLILERGVCWTTELSRDTGIGIEEINKVLSMLKRHNMIKKIYPDADLTKPQFQGRIRELNVMGITSYEKIRQFSWWTAELPCFEYVKAKYHNQGKRIKASLVHVLNLFTMEEDGALDILSAEENAILTPNQ